MYCARDAEPAKEHSTRHRRGSLRSPCPTSPLVQVGDCHSPHSPPTAFVKINNKPCNDWKVWYASRAGTEPVINFTVDVADESKKLTNFSFGVAPEESMKDPQNRENPLSQVPGAKAITVEGVYVNGYLRTVGLPSTSGEALGNLSAANKDMLFSVSNSRHPLTKKRTTELRINGIAAFSFTNDSKVNLVPCLDMADERIRCVRAPDRPSQIGPNVYYEDKCVYTEPEEKVEDFRREVDMQARVVAAANRLGLGHMVPELIGPGNFSPLVLLFFVLS